MYGILIIGRADRRSFGFIYKQDKVNTADSAFIFVIIQSQSRRKSKSMVRLVRAKKMVLCGLVFARKIARMILIQNM